jgi:hypothetical protein
VEPYTLGSTVAILMFRTYLGVRYGWLFVIFLTFSPNLEKGTMYMDFAMNSLNIRFPIFN